MGGESKQPLGFVGIPIRNPDEMTEAERDRLYELFKKRFVGLDEMQINFCLAFDDRASDFINQHEREDVFKARKAFKEVLDTIGAAGKMDAFIDYYAARERQRDVVAREVCWQAMHCRTRDELKEFYFTRDVFEPLMERFKLTPSELKRIAKRCLEKDARPPGGYFNYVLEIATKLKDKQLFSKLMGMAITTGHYESAKKLAEARKQPLTRSELKKLAKVILEERIGSGHTHWYTELFIDHPELKLGAAVVDTLLNIFWNRKGGEHDYSRDWWLLNDILRYAEKFNRPLTVNEKRLVRDRLWHEHNEENKKKALEIAYELGGREPCDLADAQHYFAMRREQFQEHLRRSEFNQAATLGKELGIEMTSRELYGQKHGQMQPYDKERLRKELIKKLVEEVGKPSEQAPAPESEDRIIH